MSAGLNDGHFVEALDRLNFAASYIEDYLLQHPVMTIGGEGDDDANEELASMAACVEDLVRQAQDLLCEAYQLVGAMDVKWQDGGTRQ
jgi:hypothetical protein